MELWQQLLLALIAVTPGVMALIGQRKKTGADTASVQVQTSISLLNEVQENLRDLRTDYKSSQDKIKSLESRIKELEDNEKQLHTTITYYLDGIRKLTTQIEKENMIPIWRPNK